MEKKKLHFGFGYYANRFELKYMHSFIQRTYYIDEFVLCVVLCCDVLDVR